MRLPRQMRYAGCLTRRSLGVKDVFPPTTSPTAADQGSQIQKASLDCLKIAASIAAACARTHSAAARTRTRLLIAHPLRVLPIGSAHPRNRRYGACRQLTSSPRAIKCSARRSKQAAIAAIVAAVAAVVIFFTRGTQPRRPRSKQLTLASLAPTHPLAPTHTQLHTAHTPCQPGIYTTMHRPN